MKTRIAASAAAGCGLLAAALAGTAQAQTSVTLYGIISEGLSYTNNIGGKSLTELKANVMQVSRWGLRGTEDLGGGTRALFNLESGFSPDTGTWTQGRLFGRTAIVGLANDTWGQVTIGRQMDAMSQTLVGYESAIQFASIGTHIGDNDNLFPVARISNSVQYMNKFGGFQFIGVYGAAEKPGDSTDNRSISAGLGYTQGPWSVGVAYHDMRRPNSATNPNGAIYGDWGITSPFVTSPGGAGVNRQSMYGAGGSYSITPALKVSALYTHSKFDYFDNSDLKLSNYEGTITYFINPSTLVGAGYIFTDGKYSSNGNKPKWHQLNLGVDYFLSKRTDVFLVGIYQKAAGDARYAQIFSNLPSDSKTQMSVIAGIRHKF
ncbi:MAG: porin [Pigmentiphaga sp.]|uniref:porin n=2 Tax=Pigmentiphaga TaxID=152267 RepID=UPI003B559135